MQLLINPNSYDKIKDFQKLLISRGINNEINHQSMGLVMNIHDNDLEMIINLAQKNHIFLERL
jgi:hypothetical protein